MGMVPTARTPVVSSLKRVCMVPLRTVCLRPFSAFWAGSMVIQVR